MSSVKTSRLRDGPLTLGEEVKAHSDEVGIHEMTHASFAKKKFPGEGGFAGVIWSGNDNAAGRSNGSGAHYQPCQLATGCW